MPPPSPVKNTISKFLQETPRKSIEIVKNNEILRFNLAPREMECLQYLVLGYCAREIGEKLEISRGTAESYIKSLKQKTGYRMTGELIREFIKNNPAYLHYLANHIS